MWRERAARWPASLPVDVSDIAVGVGEIPGCFDDRCSHVAMVAVPPEQRTSAAIGTEVLAVRREPLVVLEPPVCDPADASARSVGFEGAGHVVPEQHRAHGERESSPGDEKHAL